MVCQLNTDNYAVLFVRLLELLQAINLPPAWKKLYVHFYLENTTLHTCIQINDQYINIT